jgi:N-acyl-D-aspartate/D-glutamate deacylase
MVDYLIKHGTVVDGSGSAPRVADLAITGDRVTAIGKIDEPADTVLDAAGLIVCPGFVDPHTHYDAQLHWDGFATPSSLHGVTSVIGGNCGFTLAPLQPGDDSYIQRMMARVEGMPLEALSTGIDWGWESFGEFLDRFDGQIAVNAGFLVGHCALRRYVMGEQATQREATSDEIAVMVEMLHDALAAGGLGLSTTRSSTHSDGDGNPVASRLASEDELLELCRVVSEHEGTTLEAIVEGCLSGFTDAEVELLAGMSRAADRPLNWNVLTPDASNPDRIRQQLRPSQRARQMGGRVVALTMPVHAEMNMSFSSFCSLWLIPTWSDVLSLPLVQKTAQLRDPEVRAKLVAAAQGTPFQRRTEFDEYTIGDTIAPENKALEGRRVGDIAADQGLDAFGALVEILVRDEYRTVLWPAPGLDTEADWAMRAELWENPDVLIGGSDAGAHLDRMLGSTYPTRFLADTLRGRRLVSLERCVQLMTKVPAELFGLRDRGQLREGAFADVVVFDPMTVDSLPTRRVFDLPGECLRLTAQSIGVVRVLVNGAEAIRDGVPTGSRSGLLMRSGVQTATVSTH